MKINPSYMLFITSVFASLMMVASSPSLLLAWVAVELNTMAFIPLMLPLKHSREAEASIKYFLTQTLGSIILLIGGSGVIETWSSALISMSLLIKMGVAPFHSWVSSVGGVQTWASLFILLTIQKINPLILLSMIWTSELMENMIIFFIVCSLIIGAIMGLSQSSLQKIMVFSSINHLGWLLSSVKSSLTLTSLYFLVYCLLLLPISIMCHMSNLNQVSQLVSKPYSLKFSSVFMLSMLSMGGLPPFLGFFPKWMVIQHVSCWSVMLTLLMVFMSLITLFFYLRITFTAFTLVSSKFNILTSNMHSKSAALSLLISMSGLLLIFI